jgi:hypothetical protein
MNFDLSCFSNPMRQLAWIPGKEDFPMFVVDRSALAVLLPLALLLGAVLWSNHSANATAAPAAAQPHHGQQDQTVAANLPSR